MARRGSVRVTITGDADGLGRATRDAEGKLSRLNRAGSASMRALGTAAKAGGIAIAAGLAYGLKQSVDAAVEAERAMAQTEAVIKSTGGAANVTAKDITDLASAISLKSGIDDEAIQSGANLLLTFKNLRNEAGAGNDIFSQSTEVVTDMSVALGTDMKSAAIQVGKALNDPTIGLTALSRSGVTFTEQQKEQIKTLFESGEQMKAQKMILRELNLEFGGSAKAAGDTFSGQIDKAKVSLEETGEVIGAAVLPGLSSVATGIAEFVTEMRSGEGAGGRFRATVETAFNAVKGAVSTAINAIGGFLRRNRDDIEQTGEAFQNIGKAIGAVFENVVLPIVKRVIPAVVGFVKGMVQTIGGVVKVFSGLFTGDFRKMWEGVRQIFGGGVKMLLNAIRGVTAPLREVVSRIGGFISGTFGKAFDLVESGVRAMKRVVGGAFEALRGVVRFVIGKIVDGIDFFLSGLEAMARAAGKLPVVGDKFDDVADAIHGVRDRMRDVGNESDTMNRKLGKARTGLAGIEGISGQAEQTMGRLAGKMREVYAGANAIAGISGSASSKIGGPSGGLPFGFDPNVLAPPMIGVGSVDSFTPIASRFGLTMTSGYRPGDDGWHGQDRARDYAGSASQMLAFARYVAANFSGRLKELFHTPLGFSVKNGARVPWFVPDHFDHVHVAMRRGGKVDEPQLVLRGEEAPQHPEWVIATNPAYRQKNIGHLMDAAQALGIPGFQQGGFTGKGKHRRYVPTARQSFHVPIDRLEEALSDARFRYQDAKRRPGSGSREREAHDALLKAQAILQQARPSARKLMKQEELAEIQRQKMELADARGRQGAYDTAKGKYISHLRHQLNRLEFMQGLGPRKGTPYWRALETQIVSVKLAIKQARDAKSQASQEIGEGPTELDKLEAELAEAGLTAPLKDDMTAADKIVSYWEREYAAAKASGDPRRIKEAADALRGARDQRSGLTVTTPETSAPDDSVLQETNRLLAEQVANQIQLIDTFNKQKGAFGEALAMLVNGQLGGRVGLGFQTPSAAGRLASY